ncbi:MAG: Ku protein [Alphaproteobacteria bacterium]|nr:Ku protein [Alphaproteobacteria bacterium]
MAGRAYWKGYLKLSLVACPVKLFSATASSASRVSFNMIHKDTRNRVAQRYHDPELGEVERADLVKGYQFEKDKYVIVTPEELEEIEIESSKTISIDGFVDAPDIDPIYLDSPYFLAPDGPVAEETYAVILKAMQETNKVAIARIVLSGRERLVAIQPKPEGFLLTTLRAAKEVKSAADAFEPLDVKISDDMLTMAEQIIKQKTIPFDPAAFEDRYEQALLALVRSKIAGGEPVITKAPERGNVINLMDALRRSIEEERRPPAPSLSKAKAEEPEAADGKAEKAPAKKAAAKKSTAQKTPAKTPAKKAAPAAKKTKAG